MPDRHKHVRHYNTRHTDEHVRHLVAGGIKRLAADGISLQAIALESGCDAKTIRRARDEENTLGIACTLNLLSLDPTALDELFAAYGFRVVPLTSKAANDLHTAAGLSHAAGAMIEALEDGKRVHPETLKIADKLRPLVPHITAIIREADEIRGAA